MPTKKTNKLFKISFEKKTKFKIYKLKFKTRKQNFKI